MIGIDDTAHFEAIEKRRLELMELAGLETKAGFNPNQQRDRSGRWGSNSWYKINTKEQVSSHKKNGGSTYDPRTGKSLAGEKGMGSVALFKSRSVILDVDLDEDILEKYIEDNKDLLNSADGQYSVGTWYGGDPKQLWLDVAFVTDLKNAVKLGKENNQVAIFDLETLLDVPTGGTGKYDVTIMRTKGKNKKKFDAFGRYLREGNPNLKPISKEEFLNAKPKK